ncbi:hypothetical protein C5745_05385 [Sphingobacterium haloxyli]|uniref:Transmembrane protein n=1 Tax=Sphingobacterium haloxyli TaxID=2100533 RepID=A0A2S9J786_9SPHI|nr:hypothetical protein C5745_05385 [Sphingobacterium haloxyli]
MGQIIVESMTKPSFLGIYYFIVYFYMLVTKIIYIVPTYFYLQKIYLIFWWISWNSDPDGDMGMGTDQAMKV